MLQITLLLCLATGTLAQVGYFGFCPSVAAVTGFNVTFFSGKWYEIEKYPALFDLGGKCETITYSPNNNGTMTVSVNGTGSLFNVKTPVTGLATFVGSNTIAKMTVTFQSIPRLTNTPYWIIGTDYSTYAVVWSCRNVNLHSSRLAWLLTRNQNPSPETMAAAYAVFDMNKLSRRHLLKIDQTNC